MAQQRKLMTQQQLTKENANAVKRLIDTSSECVRSITVLKRPVDHWDDLLISLVSEKLDFETKNNGKSLKGGSIPTWKELINFLENHLRTLAAGTSFIYKSV